MTIDKDNKKWFAIYVKSRNEKKVFKTLDDIGIESFLPLITRMKQWSDRRKKVEEPLFRSSESGGHYSARVIWNRDPGECAGYEHCG